MSVTINGTNGIVFSDASTQNTAATGFGFKNRIINGAMMIDQRNAGASITPTASAYSLDRWQAMCNQSSKYSVQQNAGSVTPPAGFSKYLGVTSLSAYSVLTGDYFAMMQPIEGVNVADLNWGSANAATVTVSFWVRSSLTGTFGGALRNDAGTRSYPFTYTISSANTWEQKSVTIAGDTTGTWQTNTSTGIYVNWSLGMGATYSGTANTWAGANYLSATGATSVVGTNGATFYITGVQLEKGSTATSFDYRPYGTELALCQRYFCKSFNAATAPANGGNGTSIATVVGAYSGNIIRPNISPFSGGVTDGTSFGGGCYTAFIAFPTSMRAAPTITSYGNSSGQWNYRDSAANTGYSLCTSGGGNLMGTAGFCANFTSIINIDAAAWASGHWTASAEL